MWHPQEQQSVANGCPSVRRREMILIVNSDVTVAALRFAAPVRVRQSCHFLKLARFIRHWRRFADFHVRQKNASQPANVRAFRHVHCREL